MGAISRQLFERKTNVIPIGAKNGLNLEFQAPEKFDPDSLEVILSNGFLEKFLDFIILPDNITFQIVIDPDRPERLNSPPDDDEPFRINFVTC